jgi:hypothetical protein
MHIPGSMTIEPLWEGTLTSSGEAESYDFSSEIFRSPSRGVEQVSASIGKPFQWADGELLGAKWTPPVGGNRFYLLQLAFTLKTSGNLKITSADFCLSLGAQKGERAVVFDAFPREETIERKNALTLGVGPDFKFGTSEASLAKAETTLDFGEVIPVVYAEGLQESRLCWRYREDAKYPLKGSRRMFAILSLPPAMKTVLGKLELNVRATDRIGKLFLAPPKYDSERFRFVIGEKGQ